MNIFNSFAIMRISIPGRTVRLSLAGLLVQTALTIAIAYGDAIFGGFSAFLTPFVLILVVLALQQVLLTFVNQILSRRFPGPDKMFYRLAAVLPVGLLLNMVALGFLYAFLPVWLPRMDLLPGRMGWCILAGGFINTVLAFFLEGSSNLMAWQEALAETERLSNTYQRSRIFGLKGQLNPHFLFNCFNTLSGLIHENGNKAELFLDQMTFVHRYLLRTDNEMLVPAADELKFARAYLHLAAERFGDGLQVQSIASGIEPEWQLPPLSMQVILEDIMQRNVLGKSNPLRLRIYRSSINELCIENSLHGKKNAEYSTSPAGVINLQEKFRLLHSVGLLTEQKNGIETTKLPLFHQQNPGS